MAAIDFPASPTIGQIFDPGGGLPRYVWTGAVWNAIGTSVPKAWMSLSTAPPASPVDGDFWWQTDTGLMFLRYNDGNSTQWVIVNPAQDLAGLDTRYAQGGGSAGCFKVSSGSLASAAALVDIPLPVGYSMLELLVNGYMHSVTAVNALMRLSFDGTTFPASSNYASAFSVAGSNSVVGGGGSTAANHIIMTSTMSASAVTGATARILFPQNLASQCQNVMFDWAYQDSGAASLSRCAGAGFYITTVGRAVIARLLPGSGNINAGMSWQLNGFK